MSDEDNTSVKTKQSLSLSPEGIKLEHETTVKGVAGIIRTYKKYRNPDQFRDTEIKAASAEVIRHKLLNEIPLNEAEKLLYIAANEDGIRRALNLRAIIERAAELEPKVNDLLSASPTATPRLTSVQGPQEEPRQYFWDRFKADSEVVTDEYMREMFARVMAGEVRKPGSFSVRTLDVVRCLDEETANLFAEYGKLALLAEKEGGIPALPHVQFANLLDLSGAGLVSPTPASWTFSRQAEMLKPQVFEHGKLFFRPVNEYFRFEARPLTKAGLELLHLLRQAGPQKEVMTWIKAQGDYMISRSEDGPWESPDSFIASLEAEKA